MKNFLSFLLCVTLLTISFSAISVNAENEPICVELDGNKLEFDVNPEIIDGRTMVPLRKIFEEIGAFVKWDNDTRTVYARKNSKTITLAIDSAELKIDKGDIDSDGNPVYETVTLDVPAKIVSQRTLVPARAISESFGLNVDWDEEKQKVTITSDEDDDESWKENTGTINLTDLTFDGKGVEIKDNKINITSGGDYTLTGTLSDGNITVSTKEKVRLRLNGASITSDKDPCIFIKKADKAYITLTQGTQNCLIAENCDDGAIYSKENLEIDGSGTLNIECLTDHAIKASDNLTIENGTLNLNAFGDGIHINDTFKMTGGTVNIKASGDGIDCESIVNISSGNINIETNGTPKEAPQVASDAIMLNGRRPMWEETVEIEFDKSSKGINAEWMMCISGGIINIDSASHAIHCEDEMEINGGNFNLSSKYEKGISAHGNLTVNNKETVIDVAKSTEGIESKNVLTINEGTISVVSTDDAINATGGNSGDMHPMPPGENNGFFGPGKKDFDPAISSDGKNNQRPDRNKENRPGRNHNGEIPVMPEGGFPRGEFPPLPPNADFASTDTIPIMSDGQIPNFTMPPRTPWDENNNFPDINKGQMGRNMKVCLVINGGNLELCAGDDCLDANGNLVINGGVIKATKSNGTFSGANGIIDPDGQLLIGDKAQLILASGRGNEKSLKLTQNYITVYCDSTHSANDTISLIDSSGNVIYTYTPKESYASVLIASELIETGKTYTVTIGEETHSAQINGQSTLIGTQKTPSFGRN